MVNPRVAALLKNLMDLSGISFERTTLALYINHVSFVFMCSGYPALMFEILTFKVNLQFMLSFHMNLNVLMELLQPFLNKCFCITNHISLFFYIFFIGAF